MPRHGDEDELQEGLLTSQAHAPAAATRPAVAHAQIGLSRPASPEMLAP
eukprot:COSAG02_NODE_37179_length_445_cov_0.893064_1_plen_48_part_01